MKNEYEVRGDVTAIIIDSPKYGRYETLIDTEDLERAKEATSWILRWDPKMDTFYAVGYYGVGEKKLYLHRLVMGVEGPKVLVDHINHDTLDNRKSQLREVTYVENNQNSRDRIDNSSGCRGVSLRSDIGMWQARIQVGGARMHLGYFADLTDAVQARKDAEKKYFTYANEIRRGGM